MRFMPVLGLCVLVAGVAHAQPPAGKEVSPLVVTPPGEAPKLVSTWPAAGQAISPGLLVITLQFDQKMLETAFDIGGKTAPDCLKTPRLLSDGKTFALLCRTLPGQTYDLAFNAAAKGGFANVGGARAAPAALAFSTTSDAPTYLMEDAMKAAHLGDGDLPVAVDPGLAEHPAP